MDKMIISGRRKPGVEFFERRKLHGKKAILMTITALLMAVLFFVMFSKQNILPSYYTSQPVNTRARAMDSFVKTLPQLLGDASEIATYNALDSLYAMHAPSGKFYLDENDFMIDLSNCIRCGRTPCSGGATCTGMNGTDFQSVVDTVTNLANVSLNFDTTITVIGVDVTQDYPYDVDVRTEVFYRVTDHNFGITWSKTENISRVVSIIGLHDPLSGISTMKSYERVIKRSNICEYNDTCWDYNRTRAFYNEGAYTYTGNGTSFLQRYWNDPRPSECCGIETFLRVSDPRNVSMLDHYYYAGTHTCTDEVILQYAGISDLKLDAMTAGRYGISDNGTMICWP